MIERSLITLEGGYLLEGETPKKAIERMAKRVAEIIPSQVYAGDLEKAVFKHIWEGSICPSSPVWSNFGTERGLPISCFGSYVDDSIVGIYGTLKENAKMSQLGGGTSSYWGGVRPRGSEISGQTGSTGGVYEFLKDFDGMISRVSQGGTRRGSHAAYLPFNHKDLDEVLDIRKVGNKIQELFYGVTINEDDYERIYNEDPIALDIWARILESRNHTGIPYILNSTNANKGMTTPKWYGEDDRKILASNLCSEIMLPSNKDESFVCCLLSMNAINFDAWKDNDAVEVAIIFQEAILTDFIIKTTGIDDMQRSRRFAERHRAVGLG
jgi:ribonucleoside-diphosphate reductase alpha chain